MQDKKKLLFIFLQPSTFVNADREILNRYFEVKEFHFFEDSRSNFSIPFRWITQIFWLLKEIRNADYIFGWFVDYHLMIPAFFGQLFKKPLIAVMGGTDAMNVPEWKHGVFASSWRAPIAKYIYKRCDLLLPVSDSLISSTNSYSYYPNEKEFGLEKELGGIKSEVVPIATGYNESFWRISKIDRDPVITTVAFIDSKKRIWIKGIDLFIEVAKEVPEATFQIIGIEEDQKKLLGENIPGNIVLKGSKTPIELREIYNNSSIYLQLSRIEGFPNVLCEAMMCGCIPIGSSVFGINEILREKGYLIGRPRISEISKVVKEALNNADQVDRNAYRDSILHRFTLDKRKQALFNELGMLDDKFKE